MIDQKTAVALVPAPAYPFAPRWFSTSEGRMHYLDEGAGPPIVFVHGMPTWSFLWRDLVADLSRTHRCIAVDHLGFGRSDKPADADYHPRTLSQHLSDLITSLGLSDVTLVVHDFGGPIGLGHAIRNPDRVRRLVVFNTWMWSLADHPKATAVDRAVRGVMGHVLYRWFNGSTRWLVPRVLAPGHRLPREVHDAYIHATRRSTERVGQLQLARSLVGASDWYDELWEHRDRLADKPTQIVWGMQDPTFSPDDLQRLAGLWPAAEIARLDDAGHFPQEEAPEQCRRVLRRFLGEGSNLARSA
jgi:haloalkane dehalogenase